MNARDVERLLTGSGFTASELDERMRPLRREGLLPVGGRGPNAPPVNETHVARMLLQLTARRSADAFEVARYALKLVLQDHPDHPKPFGPDQPATVRLSGALTFLMRRADFRWRRLEIDGMGQAAWLTILLPDDQDLDLLFGREPTEPSRQPADAAAYARLKSADFGHRLILGSNVVRSLRNALSEGELAKSA